MKALAEALAETRIAQMLEETGTNGSQPRSRSKTAPMEERGVMIQFLLAFTEAYDLWDLPTCEVVNQVVKPLTTENGCRFVELDSVRPFVGKVDSFVSHTWSGKWGDLVSACLDRSDRKRRVWIDVFAVLQHPQIGQEEDLAQLENVISTAPHGTLLMWNPENDDESSNPIFRSWCLFEIHTTVGRDSPLVVKMGKRDTSSPNTVGQFIPFNSVEKITELVYDIDIRKAKATFDVDRARILKQVEKGPGHAALNTRVRTAVYNSWRIMSTPGVQEAVFGRKEHVRGLILNHDPRTYPGDPGGSLLHDLVHGNYVEACKLALEVGANVDCQTEKGNSPLMFASEGGYRSLAQVLIDHGANLDLRNGKGETALILAAKYGRVRVVELLLLRGANTTLQNNAGKTAEDCALENKMPGCAIVVAILRNELVAGELPDHIDQIGRRAPCCAMN